MLLLMKAVYHSYVMGFFLERTLNFLSLKALLTPRGERGWFTGVANSE